MAKEQVTVTKEDVFDILNAREKEVEEKITEFFYDNYNYLKENGGHVIDSKQRREALHQVLYYWKKNRKLMEKITDSEVKLTLPEQKTPNKAIPFNIEGVVDIVEEGERVALYDLKTHPAQRIIEAPQPYREQLYVYAYIWKTLQKNRLDDTAIISTPLPPTLSAAVKEMEDAGQATSPVVDKELEKWTPVIPMGYSEDEVQAMIDKFGGVVEQIEDGDFEPPPAEELGKKRPGFQYSFAVHVCRNCDARFSCPSFIKYTKKQYGKAKGIMVDYMLPLQTENEDFIDSALQEEGE